MSCNVFSTVKRRPVPRIRVCLSLFLLLQACLVSVQAELATAQQRWTPERANAWYAQQPWLVGCNYLPASDINQIEMWQDLDLEEIDRELDWAAGLGMNTVRVFLHDLCWKDDPQAYLKKMDQFLDVCAKHDIRPMIVLFDGVWDPDPQLGRQNRPRRGVHNSGWVQGPGRVVLADPAKQDQLQDYVVSVVQRFKDDDRVLCWDLFNEPDNGNANSYGPLELPNKDEAAARLVRKSFEWARSVAPQQPLTVCVWQGPPWSDASQLNQTHQAALELSDVVSYHEYGDPGAMQNRIDQLKGYGRPLICTEYMARGNGSTFEDILPLLKRERVAAYNWGLVDGKSQTKYPWPTWQTPELGEPTPWHHDIFRPDGEPYRQDEVDLIRSLTGAE
ncbi:MAG: 1,4-beta-xylanase [Planctomycetaceae bacterium]|nr:1,4-beta-xylanase [Planctomycetaceae bacterium]